MIQSDEVVAKLLTETPLRLRVAPPIVSCGRILIVGGMLILLASLLLATSGADRPDRPSWIGGIPIAALCSLWWFMSAGWQLQIDSLGIRRTRLWLWEDVWSWDDFRSGRVKPSMSDLSIFRDDQRPFFRRSLSFVLLGIEDLTRLTRACCALCEAAGTGPTHDAPERIKVVTLPVFFELEASPDGLRYRRCGVWSSVTWDELQEIRLWRPTHDSVGRRRVELCLMSGTQLPVVPSGLEQERQLIAIFQRHAADKCVEFVRFGPPASLHEADIRLRSWKREQSFSRRLAWIQAVLCVGFVLIFVAPKAGKIAELLRDSTVGWLMLAFALLMSVGIAAFVKAYYSLIVTLSSRVRELEGWQADLARCQVPSADESSEARHPELR